MVIWPVNLDSNRSRGEGRKLPVPRAVRQPNLGEIVQAATTLGYAPQANEKKALPVSHLDKAGYVMVKRAGTKTTVLKNIASEITRTRQKEAVVASAKKDKR